MVNHISNAPIQRQSMFFQNSRVLKNSSLQITQEPRVAKLAIFEAKAGRIKVNLTINVFLSRENIPAEKEEPRGIDKFQIILIIAEQPAAALHTGEFILTLSFTSLTEIEQWWNNSHSDIVNFVKVLFSGKDHAASQKIELIFQDFIDDKNSLEEEAAAAHTKFANRQRKGPQKKISHSHS